MKFIKCLACVFIIMALVGCDIEGAINDAGKRCEYANQRCEDEIAKIIQSVESTCLTKDELLEIIDSVRVRNDQATSCIDGDDIKEE